MKKHFFLLILLCLAWLAGTAAWPGEAEAAHSPANGLPTSPAFGFGGKIDPFGPASNEALKTARMLQLDWVGIDLDWAALMPDGITSEDLAVLDAFMTQAAEAGLPVMLSLQHAPAWAMTPQGPGAEVTAIFVRELALRYPALKAVELFPGANTAAAWGAAPQPADYAAVLQRTRQELAAQGLAVHLVAGGLVPLAAEGDLPENQFLQGLYDAGASEAMEIVSLLYPRIEEDLLAPQAGAGSQVFRRFESLRQVMLANNHPEGVLWITGFFWPETLNPELNLMLSAGKKQADWLQQAYALVNAQLYIGAAFFAHFNAPAGSGPGFSSLVRPDTTLHPALETLGNLIVLRGEGLYTTGSQPVTPPSQTMLPIKRMYTAYKASLKHL